MTETRKFTITRTIRASHSFEVHAAGCRDIARSAGITTYGDEGFTVEDVSAEAVVADELAEMAHQDQHYEAIDFRVFPCAK